MVRFSERGIKGAYSLLSHGKRSTIKTRPSGSASVQATVILTAETMSRFGGAPTFDALNSGGAVHHHSHDALGGVVDSATSISPVGGSGGENITIAPNIAVEGGSISDANALYRVLWNMRTGRK